MNNVAHAVVLFGDVIASRREAQASSAWLRRLCTELDAAYGLDRLAGFGFTQGDELQGLLASDADPLRAVLIGQLHPEGRPMRWAIAAGPIEPGSGPATERTGLAFLRARAAISEARDRRDDLIIVSGDDRSDVLLENLGPILAEMLSGLTERQRTVAWLMLIERQRQSDVAGRLGISRASVSVTAARGRIRSIARLADAIRRILADGIAATAADPGATDTGPTGTAPDPRAPEPSAKRPSATTTDA